MQQTRELSGCLLEHERLVAFLDTMAVMLGCAQTLESALPDATRPDVVRLDTRTDLLFIGDAKNTESPSSSLTRARLLGYMRWLSSFLLTDWRGTAVFALCHNRPEVAQGWLSILTMLSRQCRIQPLQIGVQHFDSKTCIVWMLARGPSVRVLAQG